MSALDGFLTGFFGQMNKISEDRRQTSDDYYNKQLERARSVGLTKFQERKQNAQAASDIAQRLVSQANMPANIVREVARGGLESLQNAENVWQSNAGLQPDESFWTDVYGIAKQNSSLTGQDLSTSIKEAYGLGAKPATDSLEKPAKERSTAQTFGNLFFGTGATEDAMDRLDNTEVADGMSAGELLNYTQDPTFSSSVGPNYNVLADKEAKAKEAAEKAKRDSRETTLTPDAAMSHYKFFLSNVEDRIKKESVATDVDGNITTLSRDQLEAKYAPEVAAEMVNTLGPIALQVPGIARWVSGRDTAEETPVQTDPTPTEASNTPQGIVTEIPEGVHPVVNAGELGKATFESYNPTTGRVIYRTESGKPYSTELASVMKVGSQEGPRTPEESNALLRITEALKTQNTEAFFLSANEAPPRVIEAPQYGTLSFVALKDGFAIYTSSLDRSMPVKIPIR